MACTYNYETGKITLDFHLVKYGEICDLRGVKGKVGSYACRGCPFNKGSISDMGDPVNWDSFVKCKHPQAQDSESSRNLKCKIYEDFRNEALSHYYD